MLVVGIASATQWVYISTQAGRKFSDMDILQEAERNKHLRLHDGKPTPAKI